MRFAPGQFALADHSTEHYNLDAEVAATIASTLYGKDRLDRIGHERYAPDFLVSVIKGNDEDWYAEGSATFREKHNPLYRIIMSNPTDEWANPTFARATKEAFDSAEHASREGFILARRFLVVPTAFEAGGVFALASGDTNAAVTFLGAGTLLAAAPVHRMYRHAITNPNFAVANEIRTTRAANKIAKLGLPPVITPVA